MHPVRTDHKAVQKNDPVHKVAGWLRGESDRPPIIMDGKKPYGIVNPRTILNRRIQANTKVDAITQPVPCIEADDDPQNMLQKFAEARVQILPVRDERGGLVGYRRAVDVLASLDAGPGATQVRTEQMSLRDATSIEGAVQAFKATPLAALPVVDVYHRITGELRRRDLVVTEEYKEQTQGRKDARGYRQDIRDAAIKTWTVPASRICPADADFQTLLATMGMEGECIVAKGRLFLGVITAPRLAEAALKQVQKEPIGAYRNRK